MRPLSLLFVSTFLILFFLVPLQPDVAQTAQLPDLQVLDVWLSGDEVCYTLKNAGQSVAASVGAPTSYSNVLFVDGETVAQDQITTSLLPGAELDRCFVYQWQAIQSVHTVRVCADWGQNMIVESNEENNCLEEEWSEFLPDLVVERISCVADSRLIVTVKNAGLAGLPPGWASIAEVSFNGEAQGSFDLGEAVDIEGGGIDSPGGSSRYLLDWEVVTPVNVRVVVDSTDSIQESDEDNNTQESYLECWAAVAPLRFTSGPSVSQITQTSAVVCWETNGESNSLVLFDAHYGEYASKAENTERVKHHCITLTDLAPGTAYHFRVESSDASGDRAESHGRIFQTLPRSDEQKPSLLIQFPDQLSGMICLPVDLRDGESGDRVLFLVDGELVYTDYSPPFEWPLDTRALDDGTHTFTIQGLDAAGNRSEVVQEGIVQNHFSNDESPVSVEITNPASGTDVYGIVEIAATITQEKGADIRHAEVRIDGSLVHEVEYPPLSRDWYVLGDTRDAGKPMTLKYQWDTTGYAMDQQHGVEVVAQDEFGNTGHDGVRLRRVAEPAVEIPFRLERTVTRVGNYFHVELSLRNEGTASAQDAVDVQITDESRGFQVGASDWSSSFDCLRSTIAVEKGLGGLRAGETATASYDLVPVLFDPELDDYTIGVSTSIEYKDSTDRSHSQVCNCPYIPGDYVSYPIPALPEEVGNAFFAADYLIVTDPERLFHYCDADDVDGLLRRTAGLAILENGVLGYRRVGANWWSGDDVKDNFRLNGPWYLRLGYEFRQHGYLLIVGETPIVPSFDVRGFDLHFSGGTEVHMVPDSDHPYSDLWGDDCRSELRVGRIIGQSVRELMEPILGSVGVHLGRVPFLRDNALMVSGPEGTWEMFIRETMDVGQILVDQGFTVDYVHTEYYSTWIALANEVKEILGYTPQRAFANEWMEEVEADRRGIEGHYDTSYAMDCDAGYARAQDVKQASMDKDIIYWAGHGNAGSWGWVLDDFNTGVCSGTDMNINGDGSASNPAIDFGSRRPVVFAASCLTGAYEADPGRSIARAFLRHGAAVYVGATEVSPADQNETFSLAFFEDYWNGDGCSVGDALTRLKNHYWPGAGGFWRLVIFEYNLYGDPKFGMT